MTLLHITPFIFLFSLLAGLLGSLTGLGGGIIITPVLTLLFHINIHDAMGASLISVIATSTGSSLTYVKKGFTNQRIAVFLTSATVIGATVGAHAIPYLSVNFIALLLSGILFLSAYLTIRPPKQTPHQDRPSHPWAICLHLTQNDQHKNLPYPIYRVPLAWGCMVIAGFLSGLLGIGSGVLKVLVMDQLMELPYKISTATSSLMIGITASVSAGIYFNQGYIQPVITWPVLLGVIFGSLIGSQLLHKIETNRLRILFAITVCFIGLQLGYHALQGTLS